MNLPPHLLATKLAVPTARAQWVSRPRLFERLEAGRRGKLTLIAAPAGFGKTTLLSAWRATAAGQSLPFGWVALDAGDNDPLRFWSYGLAALDAVIPGVAQPALTLLQSPQPPAIEHILTNVLNAVSRTPAGPAHPAGVLVLEDYHVITEPAIHTAVAWLLERLPDALRLIIVTRADPALPLARLRARGDLTELHADDLRFTPDEAAAFLNQTMELALTAADLAALEARTEGWIAGLQLAALALQGNVDRASFIHTFSGTNRYIVDYLAAEVLAHQPAQVQTFLLHSSILDRLCGPLCAAVLGWPAADEPPASTGLSSQGLLEALERANLFVVPLDADRYWYRYHHLFADVLRQRLTRSMAGAQITALHERASVWYEQNGLMPEAVQHALRLPDGERAAQLIQRHGLGLIVGGQTQTVLSWLNQLPEALRQAKPYLGILHALALLFTSDLESAETRLQEVERWIGPDTPPADAHFIQGNTAAIRANIALYTGDLAACAAYGERVLAWLPETEVIARTMAQLHVARGFRVTGEATLAVERRALAAVGPIRASRNLLGTLGAVINVARLQELQGRLRSAAATYQELVQIAGGPEALRGLHGALPYYVGLGDLHREWNELDLADEYRAQAMAREPGTGTIDAEYVTLGYLALARLQQARGAPDQAQRTLAAGLDLARRRGYAAHLVARVAAAQAHLALAVGHLPAAVAWATASGLHAEAELHFTREPEYLVLARVWIAQAGPGSPGDFLTPALHLLDRLMANAADQARGASLLEISIVRVLALAAQRNRPGALAELGQALTQAAPEGWVRRFVDEGPALWELLGAVDAGTVAGAPGYLALLRAALPAEPGTGPGGAGKSAPGHLPPKAAHAELYELLTERELEVLRLIAAGQSNAQVAQALVIALSTVKTHTNTIFGKLGVASRTQAIARARELQLL